MSEADQGSAAWIETNGAIWGKQFQGTENNAELSIARNMFNQYIPLCTPPITRALFDDRLSASGENQVISASAEVSQISALMCINVVQLNVCQGVAEPRKHPTAGDKPTTQKDI
ncbi:hypothetical protein BS47DRAFT_1357160 [Hydnum rufescens UP504]|uniref:Uncharacterized protein n=1 Tax=Hydnum rufescens UP504 TaxID=1448309 RepID=A0A9P6BAX8_9AGAM|nr:hypothetical protein BS47DRAFT_1357160 [Hydnum rufescens UP504]